MKTVALIPARGGSKGIPGKNIKDLNGKPLICYTIDAALGASLVDEVVVSSDSEEIMRIAANCGASVPFKRPSEFSQDDSSDRDVIMHFIEWYKGCFDRDFDLLAYLRPTTPLKTSTMIDDAIRKIQSSSLLSGLRSITKVEAVFHPYWMYTLEAEGLLVNFCEDGKDPQYYQRQNLPECYRLNGVVDVMRPSVVKKNNNNNIYGDRIGYIEIEEEKAIDIDNVFDFKLCRLVLNGSDKLG